MCPNVTGFSTVAGNYRVLTCHSVSECRLAYGRNQNIVFFCVCVCPFRTVDGVRSSVDRFVMAYPGERTVLSWKSVSVTCRTQAPRPPDTEVRGLGCGFAFWFILVSV